LSAADPIDAPGSPEPLSLAHPAAEAHGAHPAAEVPAEIGDGPVPMTGPFVPFGAGREPDEPAMRTMESEPADDQPLALRFPHVHDAPGEAAPGSPMEALPSDSQAGAHARLAQLQEELVAWIKTLVSAAVYAVLIVTFVFQVARVEGQSMAPTLEDQDRLIVNKLAYRMGEPRRGDIVMLYYPLNPEKSFVKRVIAEEGDTVRIVDGRVYVNDVPLHDEYVPLEFRSHDDWGPQVIQQGYYFVMGDHRNNSSDSRHWGPVPKKYIVGKVKVRWWPLQEARIF